MSSRLRVRPSILIIGLVLCTAFIGTAVTSFASQPQTHSQPHISVTPNAFSTDSHGCGAAKVSGTGFVSSTSQLSNTAQLTVASTQGEDYTSITPSSTHVDGQGRISRNIKVCNVASGLPDNVFTICAVDNFTSLTSNCVNVNANTKGVHMPRLSVSPKTVVTDSSGCGSVHLSGSGYTPSSSTHTNTAFLALSDGDGNTFGVFFQWGQHRAAFDIIPVDSHGNFGVNETFCDLQGVVPIATFIIGSYDDQTNEISNTVLIEAR